MKTRAHKGLCMFMNYRRRQIIEMAPHNAKQCAIAMHSTFFDIMRRHTAVTCPFLSFCSQKYYTLCILGKGNDVTVLRVGNLIIL